MMDAHRLLDDFQARGIRLIPEGGNLAVEPASRLSDADRAAIRACKPELLRILAGVRPSAIIEATFRIASAPSSDSAVAPDFPPCPECGATRYWISLGMLRCGSRACASAPRFVLTSLAFHAIN
jgi:hypothetical protein